MDCPDVHPLIIQLEKAFQKSCWEHRERLIRQLMAAAGKLSKEQDKPKKNHLVLVSED